MAEAIAYDTFSGPSYDYAPWQEYSFRREIKVLKPAPLEEDSRKKEVENRYQSYKLLSHILDYCCAQAQQFYAYLSIVKY
jgi:hypothetical protein